MSERKLKIVVYIYSGTLDLGGVSYMMDCMVENFDPATVQRQWIVGRLNALHRIIEDNRSEFMVPTATTQPNEENESLNSLPSTNNVLPLNISIDASESTDNLPNQKNSSSNKNSPAGKKCDSPMSRERQLPSSSSFLGEITSQLHTSNKSNLAHPPTSALSQSSSEEELSVSSVFIDSDASEQSLVTSEHSTITQSKEYERLTTILQFCAQSALVTKTKVLQMTAVIVLLLAQNQTRLFSVLSKYVKLILISLPANIHSSAKGKLIKVRFFVKHANFS